MKKSTVSPTFFIFLLFTSISCVKDIDFGQAEDLILRPEYLISLVYTNLDQTNFTDSSGNEISEITDRTRVDFFGSFTEDYLQKIDVDIQISNTFNRSFILEFRFVDENNMETYTFPSLSISANSADFRYTEEIDVAVNPAILLTESIDMTLTLLPSPDGSVIDSTQQANFIFKSAGTFYLQIN
ncbi:hypothetical protein [Tenacibaculum sp. SG-28]|uniref:hypothetical protein n=1 Tax=Tenacibaculum sp. SG-28 TaxID=754426 RepID=UPI000CF3A199|nr:hypothetical protein [Tenacibaculum sp. SG-28]PQJ22980.1 hypothetical protein BSU00_01510 [Tenacibaculum sp. SG-28]